MAGHPAGRSYRNDCARSARAGDRRMLDDTYTDLYTCEEVHGDPGQSTRNAAADPLERADHLAVHGAAAEPGPVHAADDARPRDLGGDIRLHQRAPEHHLVRHTAPTMLVDPMEKPELDPEIPRYSDIVRNDRAEA